MVFKLCSAESAIATCDSYNFNPKHGRKKDGHLHRHDHHDQLELRRFTYDELENATNGFSPNTLLGKGSHGAVYRAVLDGGTLIAAVKRPTSAANLAAENEIEILSRIHNRRIVNLIGYTEPEPDHLSNPCTNKLLLVVEYLPNGSLYDLIHNHPKPPSWPTRVRIALQVAEAVRTLHLSNPPVIHRDIKSSNILLDRKCNARLSDFGLALRGHVEDVRVMSTPPAGTLGYLDPCYLAPADVSAKSDVFSFGILLLEIISGRRAIDFIYSPPGIVEWALPLIKAGDYRGICDRRIGCIVDRTVIRELALLAARCVRSTAEKRPPVTVVVECIKLMYKRVQLMQAVPMWNNLRRRVRRVHRSQPWKQMDGSDEEEQQLQQQRVKASKNGSRTRKVSNVASPEDRVGEMATRVEHRTGRLKSKSVGSFREIKVGPEGGDCEISVNHLVKRRAQVSMKLSTVARLSKSRSMSVLQSSKSVSYHGNYLERNPELDVLPLLVKFRSGKFSSPKLVEDA